MEKIGFVGTGVMGSSMAGHLLEAGYEVLVYTRTKTKAEDLLDKGALWVETPGELANKVDILISMVGYPKDVEELYLGENGFLENLAVGTVAIDMTTSSPALAKKMAEFGREKGIGVLDAPVSGGDIGAKNGTLSIMVGGSEDVFLKVKPIFDILGSSVILQGDAGAGQHTKMVNQIAIASNMIGVTEAIIYAEAAGLNPSRVLDSISGGAAGSWSLANLIPRVLKDDFSPGFFIKHFIKDMGIAISEAKQMGLELPGLTLAEKMYQTLAEQGLSEEGTQALIKYYR
ncbi:NAD(P)-dependent oxidoreductase [Listeria monocytogenes]|jgi:3-hydroxyisobutyrate dehydrogenase and related beta-hydroxyacid dehydrogenases|uniref:Lmo1005 protein n=6 Tax=Listeria monocytogenes TaxID=1639 RepID=Q8Y8A5_LISMO|nr:NAD(P)-dependent oxidoreductase [Listeria monocytogenes]NP_464530.1 3-hydroxyisobutyrate dehydrogenase [Listeria monocytogenes EGD-e]EAA0164913.1 NAD(P)-dependent oxidoreductase [Listeria monocytogenes serotype 1/2a]EAD3235042.1 NAD(P)-dependent oxidoreductase [Listeria monocytogenes CFSAN002202]EAE3703289.1 NAD(P)-dependent oxidoreductase [Listeria monocytogenes serotype 1/2c]EAF4521621.1 NAD(P)-dependent oxidoreductase [Listeria monocytogenes serotype 4b]EAG6255876.1 NAD(P)-dependent oxi